MSQSTTSTNFFNTYRDGDITTSLGKIMLSNYFAVCYLSSVFCSKSPASVQDEKQTLDFFLTKKPSLAIKFNPGFWWTQYCLDNSTDHCLLSKMAHWYFFLCKLPTMYKNLGHKSSYFASSYFFFISKDLTLNWHKYFLLQYFLQTIPSSPYLVGDVPTQCRELGKMTF